MLLQNGTVFCDDGVFRPLDITIDGENITALSTASTAKADSGPALNAAGLYVVPGFIDIHIHGAMQADFSDGTAEAIHTLARFLLQQGITSFLGTSMALPEARLASIYQAARPLCGQNFPGQAVLRGIYMEGPFLSPQKCGAQNRQYLTAANFDTFCRLNEASGSYIRIAALAPEVEGGLAFIEKASRLCRVSLAHSAADYNTACKAFACGASQVTHLFNAMPPFAHREPGIVGAAADANAYAELICDGVHLHPSMVRSAFKLFGDERICLISDAMRACGMPNGVYELGELEVSVQNGVATLNNGTLAGSTTSLAEGFRRAVSFGVPLESALKAVTHNPAKAAGLYTQLGSITPGKRADILLLDKALQPKLVIIGGGPQPPIV